MCISIRYCCSCCRILCYGYIAFTTYNKSIVCNCCSCLVFTYGVSSNRNVLNRNVSVCRYCNGYFRITERSICADILACRIRYCYIKGLACRECISRYCLADSKASLILCISIRYCCGCCRILGYCYIAFTTYNKSVIRDCGSCLVFTYGVSSNWNVLNRNVSVCRYCNGYFRITECSICAYILASFICYCYIELLLASKVYPLLSY